MHGSVLRGCPAYETDKHLRRKDNVLRQCCFFSDNIFVFFVTATVDKETVQKEGTREDSHSRIKFKEHVSLQSIALEERVFSNLKKS
jgi:hypothetical protein